MAVTAPEFSRPIRLDTLGDRPQRIVIEADEAERAALADRFGLVRLDALAAKADLSRDGDVVTAIGTLTTALVQACVATGADVPATIAEPFTLRFAPEAAESADEVELDESELDIVSYEGGAVDLGEAAAQTLALALDPFPRAPDADDVLRQAGVKSEEQVTAEASPFAQLIDLKDRLKR